MKKSLIIIISVILIIIIFGIFTSCYDKSRVNNNLEPKFTIKIINKEGNKITYWGLGYKVIRYVGVSPNEPFKNNIGVKFGSWFMEYELPQKNDDSKKYEQIKENVKIAVEKSLKVQYPSCPIKDVYDENLKAGGRHYNSSFLISNGYIKKSELLDVDNQSYCDVYVDIKAHYENEYDHQNNCNVYYKIYLKCNNYEDAGYINWEE